MNHSGRGDAGSPDIRAAAARVAALYALLALGWILFSDLAVAAVVPEWLDTTHVDIAKGSAFVLVTAACLFRWTRREMVRRERTGARLRRFVADAPDLIYRYRVHPDPGYEFVSPAALSILGYSPAEVIEDPALGGWLLHHDGRTRADGLVPDSDALAEPAELRCVHRDGREVWLEQRARLVTDEAGNTLIEGICRDITARKRDEARAHLLATAVEASGDAVIICDPDGIIRYVNPSFTRMTGYALDDVLGSTPRILKSGHQPEEFYRQLWSTVTAGRVFQGEFVNRRKDGSLYTHQATITPVVDEAGVVRSIVAAARDVTVERRLEADLQRARMQELVGRMASGTAHDFKNMLALVQLSTEAARGAIEEGRAGDAISALREVESAAQRGARLVRRLLALGRGSDALDIGPGDLGAAVRELEPALRTLLPASAVLEVNIEPGLPAVSMNADAVEQIVVNLVTNAANALGDGGRVTVSVERDRSGREDGIALTVRDTGMGIPAGLIEHIFEPFFTTRAGEGGSGLGLTMVHALVQRQHATLHVSSVEGVGTEMTIVFAAAGPSAVSAPPTSSPERRVGRVVSGERLLLVDDEPSIRSVLARSLAKLGYEVVTAGDGLEAQTLLCTRGPFDLVVTDVHMPAAGGVDLYRRARELGLPSRFLFMSGDATVGPGREAFVGERAHFIEKPYTLSQVASKVREVLDAA